MNPILVKESFIDVRGVHDQIAGRLRGRPVAGQKLPVRAVINDAQGHAHVADIGPEYPCGDLLDVRLERGKPASDKCENTLPIDFDAEFLAPPFPVAEGENRPFALRTPKLMPRFIQSIVKENPAPAVPVLGRKVPILWIGTEHTFPDARLQDSGPLQVGCRREQLNRRLRKHRSVLQEPNSVLPFNA